MKIFYVRPARDGGYGEGDGTTYDNAWNGFKEVDWDKVKQHEPATVWVCGNGERPSDFMTVHVELSYLLEQSLADEGSGKKEERKEEQRIKLAA